MEKILTAANFEEEVVNASGPVLVDFWATWCGPCKRQGPILSQLAEEGYSIGKVDVDEEPSLAQQFQVMSIPTLILFRNGKETQRLVGLSSKETLKGLLDA